MAQRGRQGESPRRPSGSRTSLSLSPPRLVRILAPIPVVRFPLSSSPVRTGHAHLIAGARGQREHATQARSDRAEAIHLTASAARSLARLGFFLPPCLAPFLSRSLLQLAIPQSKHIPFSLLPPSASALAAAAAGTLLAPLPPPRQVKPRAPWLLVDRESPPPVCRRAAAAGAMWVAVVRVGG